MWSERLCLKCEAILTQPGWLFLPPCSGFGAFATIAIQPEGDLSPRGQGELEPQSVGTFGEIPVERAYPHANGTIGREFGPETETFLGVRCPLFDTLNSRLIAASGFWRAIGQGLWRTGICTFGADITKRSDARLVGAVKIERQTCEDF